LDAPRGFGSLFARDLVRLMWRNVDAPPLRLVVALGP
jgi:hypothetical protein